MKAIKALKPSKEVVSTVGTTAFLVGVILALAGGIVAAVLNAMNIPSGQAIVTSLLIIAGIIVGILNITDAEAKDFLLSALVLVFVTSSGATLLAKVAYVGPYFAAVLLALMTFVIPAAVIVSLKAIYKLAKDE